MPFDGHTNVRMQILLDARSLLAKRSGWCQEGFHMYKNGGNSYCIYGALQVAAQQYKVNLAKHSEGKAVVKSVLLALGEPKSSTPNKNVSIIVVFNDTKNRRKHEVLSLMDRAMEYLV